MKALENKGTKIFYCYFFFVKTLIQTKICYASMSDFLLTGMKSLSIHTCVNPRQKFCTSAILVPGLQLIFVTDQLIGCLLTAPSSWLSQFFYLTCTCLKKRTGLIDLSNKSYDIWQLLFALLERIKRIIVHVEWNLVIEDVRFVTVLILGTPHSYSGFQFCGVCAFLKRNAGNWK